MGSHLAEDIQFGSARSQVALFVLFSPLCVIDGELIGMSYKKKEQWQLRSAATLLQGNAQCEGIYDTRGPQTFWEE